MNWFIKISQLNDSQFIDPASIWNSLYLNDRDMMIINSGLAIPVEQRRQLAETKWDLIKPELQNILKPIVQQFRSQ